MESHVKVVEWNPEEEMSKEYALTMIDEMRCFIRKRYYMPKTEPFNGKADFESRLHELNGLKEFIENNIR